MRCGRSANRTNAPRCSGRDGKIEAPQGNTPPELLAASSRPSRRRHAPPSQSTGPKQHATEPDALQKPTGGQNNSRTAGTLRAQYRGAVGYYRSCRRTRSVHTHEDREKRFRKHSHQSRSGPFRSSPTGALRDTHIRVARAGCKRSVRQQFWPKANRPHCGRDADLDEIVATWLVSLVGRRLMPWTIELGTALGAQVK
jgi:hypothetical protein